MFVAPPNVIDDEAQVRRLVARAGSAQFVTVGPDGVPEATLLPIMWDEDTVVAHIARANPQWRHIGAGTDSPAARSCLLICSGPQAYVSPSWYPTKAQHGRVVPTWNYSAVHLFGTVTVHHDREWLRDVVRRLTDTHESHRADRWQLTDAPQRFIDAQLKGIVGLEVTVSRIDAKAKLSQNRSAEDQRGVIDGLRRENICGAGEIAEAMTSPTVTCPVSAGRSSE